MGEFEDVDAKGITRGGGAKVTFFSGLWQYPKILVVGNQPLSELLFALRKLFRRRYKENDMDDTPKPIAVDAVSFEEVSNYFQHALAQLDWPENDFAVQELQDEYRTVTKQFRVSSSAFLDATTAPPPVPATDVFGPAKANPAPAPRRSGRLGEKRSSSMAPIIEADEANLVELALRVGI